jgi:hypothetical protein
MSAAAGPQGLSRPWIAGLILAVFWLALVASLRDKSYTADEAVHATAGYTRWRFNDYRINPENGNLPQRWVALPLLAGNYPFPPLDSESWRNANAIAVSEAWFDHMGNDLAGMLARGRAMSGLLAVALGALVWWWSRELFGPVGGLVSLLAFVLDPTVLANGALMTSDTAAALFFLLSLYGLWRVLHRISATTLLASALAMGGLFVSKMSATLIVPIAGVLCLIRIFAGPAVQFQIGRRRPWAGRGARAGAFAGVALAHAVVVCAVIWAFHGFRFEALSPGASVGSRLEETWTGLLGTPTDPHPPVTASVWQYVRTHRLLPEAYAYGQAHTWKFSRLRSAFLNGQFSLTGWWWFFPYTFLVKTPLSIFGLMALAALGLRRPQLYATLPLFVLLGAYWAAALVTPLNIGHRHVLPTYPPLFVLCGAAGYWLRRAGSVGTRRRRLPGLALGGLLVALAAEAVACFPNYLAYFNVLAGGSAHGYRHLVDSSLDWGQDLPGVKRYIETHAEAAPAFLAYFGMASPDAYQMPAQYLHSVRGQDVAPAMRVISAPAAEAGRQLADLRQRHPEYQVVGGAKQSDGRLDILLLKAPAALRLAPGTYFISATLLQPVMYDFRGPLGPWNERYERTYQALSATVAPLQSPDAATRDAALPSHSANDWATLLDYFDLYRFARLTAYLRQREADDTVNGSVLVYHLGPEDLAHALGGPPPETGIDLPAQAGTFRAAALP